MFAYCNNAPTASHDSDGECTRFLLWKIDCGKAACEESSNYNPAAERVAVIYDSRTSGYLGGLIGGKGFARQASGWVCELEDEYIVDEFPFTDMDGFVDSWNSMDGEYSAAFIIMHGYPGGLSCSGKNLTNAPNGDYSFFDLNPIPITTVYLFSCHGATFSERNESVASNLAYLTGGNVWAIYGGTVKYAIYGYMPYSQNGSWSRTKGRNTVIY